MINFDDEELDYDDDRAAAARLHAEEEAEAYYAAIRRTFVSDAEHFGEPNFKNGRCHDL